MNYLIFRNDGIGDLIVTSSALNKIKKNNHNVYLVCSYRNVEYATELKKSQIITDFVNIDKYKGVSFLKFLDFISLIRSFKPDVTIIYRVNSLNTIISLATFPAKIYSLIYQKKGKVLNKKSKIPLFLAKVFFSGYEIIDETNDYISQINTHMYKHFNNLVNIPLGIKTNNKNKTINYPLLTSLKDLKKNAQLEIEKTFKTKKFILFHLDEKWIDSNINVQIILEIIMTTVNFKKEDYIVVITTGFKETTINKKINNFLNFKDIPQKKQIFDIMQSIDNENIYLFRNINIKKLTVLISLSKLVIEPHGALTHIASLYNTPVIDIIRNDSVNFFKKWAPISSKNMQVEYKDLKNFKKILNNFI